MNDLSICLSVYLFFFFIYIYKTDCLCLPTYLCVFLFHALTTRPISTKFYTVQLGEDSQHKNDHTNPTLWPFVHPNYKNCTRSQENKFCVKKCSDGYPYAISQNELLHFDPQVQIWRIIKWHTSSKMDSPIMLKFQFSAFENRVGLKFFRASLQAFSCSGRVSKKFVATWDS